jgi:hypothetical protein
MLRWETRKTAEKNSCGNEARKQESCRHRNALLGRGGARLRGMAGGKAGRKMLVREGSGFEGHHNGVLHGHGGAITAAIHNSARCQVLLQAASQVRVASLIRKVGCTQARN